MTRSRKTKFLAVLIAIVLIISSIPVYAYQEPIYVCLDGQFITFDTQPEIKNKRTMVPMRAILEKYGMTVSWDSRTQTATAYKFGTIIKLTIDSTTISYNGKSYTSDVAPYISGSRTLIPLRILSECMGMNVEWSGTNRTVYINSSGGAITSTPAPSATVKASYEQRRVVELVNAERAAYGLSALTMTEDLNYAAQLKAQDMINNNYFDHISPTYGNPGQLLRYCNISCRSYGENIAAGQKTPEEVVEGWMNSESHRENILSPYFNHIGIGYATGGYYGTYWVQEFTD